MLRISFTIFLAVTAWIHPLNAVSAFAEPQLENPTFINYEKFHQKPVQPIEKEPRTNDGRGVLQPRKNLQSGNNQPSQAKYSSQVNGDIQIRIKAKVIAKWGESEWAGMHYILDHESGSDPYAQNPKSSACGIPQATPCSKMLKVIGSLDNVDGQLDWMINYIANRYKTPTKAMIFHQSHGWY